MMRQTTAWILIIAALIVGGAGGFLFEKQRATTKLEDTKMMMQKQIDDTKMMTKPTESMMQDTTKMMSGVLVDTKGMTLYTFDKDTQNQSNCTGNCLINWPPFYVVGTVPTTLPTHMGTFKTTGGQLQYTWDGKPLYYYAGDKKTGDTNGDNVGGVWHIVK